MKHREDILKIGNTLVSAYRLRQETTLEPGVDFKAGVMQSIHGLKREERSLGAKPTFYEKTVWRFAYAASLLALLFLALSIHSDSRSFYQQLEFLLDESAGLSIAQSFGLL